MKEQNLEKFSDDELAAVTGGQDGETIARRCTFVDGISCPGYYSCTSCEYYPGNK